MARSQIRRWLVVAVLAGCAALPFAIGKMASSDAAPAKEPTSPDAIPFDHTIHVGKYGMACLGCHVDAPVSTTAGLPSVRKCMGCHKFVDKEKPAIQALAKLWESGQAPKFRRVHDLPDYVYFSHRVHIAASVACATCHGDVGKMTKVVQVSPLTMGWCLSCHKERNATLECIGCHK